MEVERDREIEAETRRAWAEYEQTLQNRAASQRETERAVQSFQRAQVTHRAAVEANERARAAHALEVARGVGAADYAERRMRTEADAATRRCLGENMREVDKIRKNVSNRWEEINRKELEKALADRDEFERRQQHFKELLVDRTIRVGKRQKAEFER